VFIRVQVIIPTPLSSDELSVVVLYSQKIISEAEVNVILDHFEATILSLITNPHDAVGDVNLINTQESLRLIAQTHLRAHLSPAHNVAELIEAQASRTPQKIAVCFPDLSLLAAVTLTMNM
jgi:non-ribosomal peptide synthetase component F